MRVLNPSNLALIYGSMKKTDKEDALKLAHIGADIRDERLQTAPGVGPKGAFAYLAVERFINAAQVSNYRGLVPKVYRSGDTVR